MPAPEVADSFRYLDERPVHRGAVISVSVGRFAAPDGTEFERDVVRHPGAVSVVPLTDRDEVLLVRQYRAALDRDLWEIPAGKRDVPGEPPEVTAGRELAEEVGIAAAHLELLAEFHNSPGFCDERSFTFLGRGLTPVATDRQGIEEQHLVVRAVPLDDVASMIASGELTDAKTLIGLFAALRVLGR